MLIKSADDKSSSIRQLELLLQQADTAQKKSAISKEINILRAGIKGEKESAYLIDFELEQSKNFAVIHDLRIEVNGRVAQIDHLLINRAFNIYILETKHFNSGIKITDDGEFLRWNSYKKSWEGMPSPIKQNERHIQVLEDCFKKIAMPTRLGIELTPTFESYVLINSSARIDRSAQFNSNEVIKAEMLMEKIRDSISTFKALKMIPKLVASETVENIANELCKLHQPMTPDYAKRFAITPQVQEPITPYGKEVAEEKHSDPQPEDTSHLCGKCKSNNITIEYGRYGYYFKCSDCDGNTSIKINCEKEGHKEKIRKQKNQFFRECAECSSSSLYFTNPAE